MRLSICTFLIFTISGAALCAAAAPPPTVEIVVDSSGSMAGRIASGEPKIDAARGALAAVVRGLSDDVRLAVRAYGHRSAKEKHDCDDTELLVPFGPVGAARERIAAAAAKLVARGYTPITAVLTLAARDLPPAVDGGARTVVLVSDGVETCAGDPCALARELRAKDAGLVIHTVGFDADAAARGQLECIAAVAGGRYFDAADGARLAAAIAEAVRTPGVEPPAATGNGWLKVSGADIAGHLVQTATDGKVVATISRVAETVAVPAGIYNVSFGALLWRSVAVEAGKTTVLAPGILKIKHPSIQGHAVLTAETGVKVAVISNTQDQATLLPGVYDVRFGEAVWPLVKVDGGAVFTLDPGVVEVKRASVNGHRILASDGRPVGSVSATGNWASLPPGEYKIELGKEMRSFTLAPGQRLVFEIK